MGMTCFLNLKYKEFNERIFICLLYVYFVNLLLNIKKKKKMLYLFKLFPFFNQKGSFLEMYKLVSIRKKKKKKKKKKRKKEKTPASLTSRFHHRYS